MNILLLVLLLGGISSLPDVPDHSFEKRVLSSKVSVTNETENSEEIPVKKVFVKFVQGPFTFKKRKEKCGRVTFTCNGCQKFNHFLSVLPSNSDHVCVTSRSCEECLR